MMERERGTCPECGSGQVNHLVFGMPIIPPGESTPEWVKFAGCIVTPESRSRYCQTCEYSWNPEDDAEEEDAGEPRPRLPSRRPQPRLIHSVSQLLRRLEVETLDELSELVDGSCDLDMYVTLDEVTNEVTVRCVDWGFPLEFPFTIAEFWEAVNDLEDDVIDRLEEEDSDE